VAPAQRELAEEVMQATGTVEWVTHEAHLDVVTALSGSGPAYFFLLAELLAEAAAREGLDAAVARRLAAQTLYGAGLLATAADADLARLREEVTSKGGTTAAALAVLGAGQFDHLVARAVAAATARSRELAQQLGAG
jgi:pyrroline-5-carboxylate reductase